MAEVRDPQEIVAGVVCACGDRCTTEPLTRQTAEIWACLHQLVCPLMRCER